MIRNTRGARFPAPRPEVHIVEGKSKTANHEAGKTNNGRTNGVIKGATLHHMHNIYKSGRGCTAKATKKTPNNGRRR